MKHFKNRALSVILTMAMVFTGITVSPSHVKAESSQVIDLQILATSDLHGRFVPYDYAINTIRGVLPRLPLS